MKKETLAGIAVGLTIIAIVGGAFFLYKAKNSAPTSSVSISSTPTPLPQKIETVLLKNEKLPDQKDQKTISGIVEKLPSCLENLLCFKIGNVYATELTPQRIGGIKLLHSDSYLNNYVGKNVSVIATEVPASGKIPAYSRIFTLNLK